MKLESFLIVGMTLVTVVPLCAAPPDAVGNNSAQKSAHLKKQEKNLKRMQANRSLDNDHTVQAQEEFLQGTVDMSDHAKQHSRDIQELKSVEKQIIAGNKNNESQQVMDPLRQSQKTLKADVHHGDRQAHNDKVVLSVQKRTMDSNAHYRASDDRNIAKAEKNIADDRRDLAESLHPPELPSSK